MGEGAARKWRRSRLSVKVTSALGCSALTPPTESRRQRAGRRRCIRVLLMGPRVGTRGGPPSGSMAVEEVSNMRARRLACDWRGDSGGELTLSAQVVEVDG